MRFPYMPTLTLAACLACVALGQVAGAQLVNGSFETGSYSFDGNGADSLNPGSTVITGWTTTNAEMAVISNTNIFALASENGSFHLDLTGYHDSSPYGGVQQVVNTVAGRSYTLDLFLATQSGGGATSVLVNTVGTPTTFTTDPSGPFWQEFSDTFTATGPTTLDIIGAGASGGGHYIGVDNVTLAGDFSPTATPEPGSMALLIGAGLTGGLCLRRARSRKR